MLTRWMDKIIDLVFIPNGRCPLCYRILFFTDEYICDSCKEHLEYIRGAGCKKCGKEVKDYMNYCSDCISNYHSYERGISLLNYTGSARKLIYQIKFDNNPGLGIYMGKLLAKKLNRYPWFRLIDTIIPVPLHENRLCERGYNQSEMICQGILEYFKEIGNTHLSIDRYSLVRRKDTPHQLMLERKYRYKNVKNAFQVIDKSHIRGKAVLLVDDVYTTGATVEECSNTLVKNGADKVYFAVLASGVVGRD